MPKKILGEYHYAIKALENALGRVKNKPHKFTKSDERIRSLEAALAVLKDNDLPPYDSRKPLTPVPLAQLFDEEEAAASKAFLAETRS